MPPMTGKVCRVVDNNAFGFIKSGNREFFFHREDYLGDFDLLRSDYRAGKQVEVLFAEVSSNKGPRAANVSRVE